MLRIRVPKQKDQLMFVLEGRPTGGWIEELLRITRKILPGTKSVFDIENALFADQSGEKALQWLDRLGRLFLFEIHMASTSLDDCTCIEPRRKVERRARKASEGPAEPLFSRDVRPLEVPSTARR